MQQRHAAWYGLDGGGGNDAGASTTRSGTSFKPDLEVDEGHNESSSRRKLFPSCTFILLCVLFLAKDHSGGDGDGVDEDGAYVWDTDLDDAATTTDMQLKTVKTPRPEASKRRKWSEKDDTNTSNAVPAACTVPK